MKKSLIVLSALVALSAPLAPFVGAAFAAEELTLSTPVTKASVTKWRVKQLILDAYPEKHVSLTLYDPATPEYTATCVWTANTTPTATQILSTLNTANLTSNSLQRRAVVAAQNLGCIGAGAVAGTPD